MITQAVAEVSHALVYLEQPLKNNPSYFALKECNTLRPEVLPDNK
jgi:hypothetical protein